MCRTAYPLTNGLWRYMFYAYALYNKVRNKIYIGQSNNPVTRLKRHNGEIQNKKRSYTSINDGKWITVYQEEHETRKDAIKREKQLKTQKGREFIWKIIRSKDWWS